MSQDQGLDGEIQSPGPAPWSAPDPIDDRPPPASAAAMPPAAPTPEPVYRAQQDGIPLRPLGIGELLDGTFGTIRRNPRATVGLAALLVTLQQLVALVVELATNGLPTFSGIGDEALSVQTVLGGFGGVAGTLLAAVVGAVLTGMLVVVVSEDVLGRRVTAADVWRRIRPRLWPLLLAGAIAGILPYVGLVILVLPGLVLWAAWSLTTPALVLEGIGPVQALRRSWRLAWPALARVWWVRALSVLMGLLIQVLIAVPFALVGVLVIALAGGDDTGTTVSVVVLAVGVLGGIAAGMITAPFLAGVLALLYIDRRMRAEGLDLVLRRQERIGGSQRPVPAPSAGGGP